MIVTLAKLFLWALEQLSPKEEEKPKSHKTDFDVIRTDLLSVPKKTEETSTLPTSPVVDPVVKPTESSVVQSVVENHITPAEPVVELPVEQAVPPQSAAVEKPKKPKTKRKTTKKKSDKK
jgi:hypothetical protein